MGGLVPWDALDELAQFFRALEGFFGNDFAGVDTSLKLTGFQDAKVEEDDEKIVFCLNVPDDFKNKMDVRVDDKKIEIFGQVSDEKTSLQDGSKACSWKSVYHSFSLPDKVYGEKAQVSLQDSKLVIQVPKKPLRK